MLDYLTQKDKNFGKDLNVNRPLKYIYHSKKINDTKETLLQIKHIIIQESLSKNKKDLENLVIYFNKKLKLKKDDVDLTIGLGNALEKLQEERRLKKLFLSFDKNIIGSEIIKKRLADIFYKEENFTKAVENYEFYLNNKKNKYNKDLYIKIIDCFYNLKRYDKCSDYLHICLENSTEFSSEVLLLFGNVFLKSKKYEKAIEQFLNGIQIITKYLKKIEILSLSSEKSNKINKENFLEAIKYSSPQSLFPKFLNNIGNAHNKIGNYNEAEKFLIKAISLEKNPYTLNNLALSLKAQGKKRDALNYLLNAIQIETKSAKIYFNLAEIYLSMNDINQSQKFLNETIKLDPNHEGAKLKSEILNGHFKGKIPLKYLERHFDDYSETFDKYLLSTLHYKVPLAFSKIMKSKYEKNYSLNNILDLGCGTGLCGIQIKNNFNKLVGIDISKQMLNKAKQRSIYTKLICTDIINFLKNTKQKYEIIMAADVLIYLGDLNQLFKFVRNVMFNNARFIFSTEETKKGEYMINQNGRFSHSHYYITKISQKYELIIETYQDIKIRKEDNKWVNGKIFTVMKNH
tara:strand:+ start:67 stop:1785 length:1719 start_codon:yes stop_codon:yes gene_type:complete